MLDQPKFLYPQDLPLGRAAEREIDIIDVFRYANCCPSDSALFDSGKWHGIVEGLVTDRVALVVEERKFKLAKIQGRMAKMREECPSRW